MRSCGMKRANPRIAQRFAVVMSLFQRVAVKSFQKHGGCLFAGSVICASVVSFFMRELFGLHEIKSRTLLLP